MAGQTDGRLSEKIKADDGILVNLASSEMKRLFDWKRICREVRVVTPEFRIREDDRLKTVVVHMKCAAAK
ncbi:MAG: peroxide stress protein YaaA [Alistipes finegoldii]